jgi:hypothetical protein
MKTMLSIFANYFGNFYSDLQSRGHELEYITVIPCAHLNKDQVTILISYEAHYNLIQSLKLKQEPSRE